MPMMAMVLGLGLAAPQPVQALGNLVLTLNVFDVTESRFTEVAVRDVNGVSETYMAPDPFMAPFTSDQNGALNLAFSNLGVPGPVDFSTLVTSIEDLPDLMATTQGPFFSQTADTILIGDLGVGGPVVQFDFGQLGLTPNTPTTFDGDFLQNATGLTIHFGSLFIHLNQNKTTIDAFRLNVTQDLNGGGGPAPVPEPSTMLLLGSGIMGLVSWRRKVGSTL